MSLYDYRASRELIKHDLPFYALIMSAMAKADTANSRKLRAAWPEVWAECEQRYNAPGGMLPAERQAAVAQATKQLTTLVIKDDGQRD